MVYHFTKEEAVTKAVKRSDDFREAPEILTGSATLADYRRSGYDRGHLAPAAEYANFIGWANKVFPAEAFAALPLWEQVFDWRGKLIAVCDYEASYTPGPSIWNEGYPVWWHLTNVRLLDEPILCRKNAEMRHLPEDFDFIGELLTFRNAEDNWQQ